MTSTTQNNPSQNLNTLALFHYIVGGMFVLMACFPLIHFFTGLGLLIAGASGAFESDTNETMPMLVGGGFVIIGFLFFVVGEILAICVIISGRFLSKRVYPVFSMVVAGICCMLAPFGTILGVFTLISLSKPEIKTLYQP